MMNMITSEVVTRLQRVFDSMRKGEDTELAEIDMLWYAA